MYEKNELVSRVPGNSKAGLTVCFNQKEGEEPFEAAVCFKKTGEDAEELREEYAVTLTASGKPGLDSSKNNFVKIFAEKSSRLKEIEAEEIAGSVRRREE